MAMGKGELLMWTYNKTLQYPINIKCTDPRLAKVIISQYGGPDEQLILWCTIDNYLSYQLIILFNRKNIICRQQKTDHVIFKT